MRAAREPAPIGALQRVRPGGGRRGGEFVVSRVVPVSPCRPLLLAAAVSTGCFAETPTAAPAAADGARWACRYVPDNLTIRCLLIDAAEGAARPAGSAIERRLPAFVRVIRQHPVRLVGVPVAIPLWSVPYETAFVRQLAESVMCGARRDCRVDFDAGE